MKKSKTLITTLVAICGIAIIITFFLVSDKNLNVDSIEVENLYNKLGEVNINRCGGLNTYSNKDITFKDISLENRLCMAYYQVTKDDIQEKNTKITGKNDNDIKICKIGETTLSANDDEKECKYEEIDVKTLKEAYKNLYGKELKENDNFYITETKACFKEGEKYLCGTAESYKMAIAPESSIYRVINKAVKKLNGDVIIEDIFLKISGNVCYKEQNSNEKSDACTKAIKDKDLKSLSDDEIIDLVKKYGSSYKHTFKEANNNHYWEKTELKK